QSRPPVVLYEVPASLQILIYVLFFFFNTAVLDEFTDAASVGVSHVVPHKPKLSLCLVKEQSFDFLAIELGAIFTQVFEGSRAGNLNKVGKIASDFDYPAGIPLKLNACSG